MARVKKLRDAYAAEMMYFSQCLDRIALPNGNYIEKHGLESAHSAVRRNGGGDKWAYAASDILFSWLPSPQKTIPCEVGEITVRLSVQASGRFTSCDDLADPMESMAVDMVVSSSHCGDYLNAWHWDRHIGSCEPAGGALHHRYHVQHGGRELNGHRFGGLLQMSAPRMMCFPMDVVLAVDYVLANFAPSTWSKFREDNQYRNLVAAAQARFWHPWILALGSHVKSGKRSKEDWCWSDISPDLVELG